MCWLCDHPDRTLGDYLELLREKIRRRGWVVQYVEDGRHSFAYTIGLHARSLPELLVTGLEPRPAQWLLDTFAKRALTGPKAVAGQRVLLPAGARVELTEVGRPDAHMGMATAIEGGDITAMQLVWADDRGRWPWAPNFDDGCRFQPVLGIRAGQA